MINYIQSFIYIGDMPVELKPYSHFSKFIFLFYRVMTSFSDNQITSITSKMQNTTIRDLCAIQMRRALGSKKIIISEVSNEWKNTLIRKLFSKDPKDTEDVSKATTYLWKRYKIKEVRALDKNIFLFKFYSDETMGVVLKKGP